jgi:hypothetical protein
MNQISYIKKSCLEMKNSGIQLVRFAMYDWTKYSWEEIEEQKGKEQIIKIFVPKSCSALGAVLYRYNREFSLTPWSVLQKVLGVNDHWLYRFTIGWGQRTILSAAITNQSGDIVRWTEDDVSRAARDLSKELIG